MSKLGKPLDLLRNILEEMQFFKSSSDKQIYGSVQTIRGRKILAIKCNEFESEVKGRYFDVARELPQEMRYKEAIAEISMNVDRQYVLTDMYLKIASHGEAVYVDLSDGGKAVEINASGWRVVEQAPVIFRPADTAVSMPEPQLGGDINLLRKYVNVHRQDFILLVAYLLGAFRPSGPYPILVLEGQQGSAKSTLSRIVKAIVDPSSAPLRGLYTDEKEMLIALQNSHLLVMDNLSGVSAKISDIICRVSTGGAISFRTLYTNADEFLLEAMRPLVLNGIDSITKRGDLASRSIVLELPKIDKNHRKTEEEIFSEFQKDLPFILGAIMDGISAAIKNRDHKPIVEGRLADFEVWVRAGLEGMGLDKEEFSEAYRSNLQQVTLINANENPIVQAVQGIMKAKSVESLLLGQSPVTWCGTSSELLSRVREFYNNCGNRNPRHMPRADWSGIKELSNPTAFGIALTRSEPDLHELGIQVEKKRKKAGMEIRIHAPVDIFVNGN